MSTKKQFFNLLKDAIRGSKSKKVPKKALTLPKHKMVKSRRVR